MNRRDTRAIGVRYIGLVVSFLGAIILGRLLGSEQYGVFYLVVALAGIGMNPLSGVWTAVRRAALANVDEHELVGLSLGIIAGWTALVSVVTYLLQSWFHAWWFVIAIPGFLIAHTTFDMVQAILDGADRWDVAISAGVASTILMTLTQLALVSSGLESSGMVIGSTGATIGVLVVVWNAAGIRPAVPTQPTIGAVWKRAQWSVPRSVVTGTYLKAETVILGLLATTALLGKYEAAVRLLTPAILISEVIGRSTVVRVGVDPQASEIREALEGTSILAIPMLIGAVVVGSDLLTIVYGPTFSDAGLLVVGVAVYYLVRSQLLILQNAVEGLDQMRSMFYISVAGLAVDALLLGVVVVSNRLELVVVPLIVAEALRATLFYRIVYQHFGCIIPRQVGVQLGLGAMMLIITVIANQSFSVLPTIAIGGTAYTLGLLATDAPLRRRILQTV